MANPNNTTIINYDLNDITRKFSQVMLNSTVPTPPIGSSNIMWQTDQFGNISAFVTSGSSQFATNVTPLALPHWTSAVSRVRAGSGNARVYCIGDSTTFGTFSNGTTTGDLTVGSYPTRLSQILTASGLPAQRASFMGDGGGFETTGANDSRVVLGDWTQDSFGVVSTGGALFQSLTPTVNAMTFTPTEEVDTFVIWYSTFPSNGEFTATIDSGSPTTISTVSGSGLASTTVTAGSVGVHTLSFQHIDSNAVFIIGVEAHNSTTSAVCVTNAGWAGALSNDWNRSDEAYAPIFSVPVQSPDLILLDLGINNWREGTDIAGYTADMQALITAWSPNSDIVIVTPDPSSTSYSEFTTVQNMGNFVAAMYSLAKVNNLPLIDNYARWGSFARASVPPLSFYGDGLHPNGAGYSDFAQAIATQLLSVV